MKKIQIVLVVLATAALTSCQEEKSFNGDRVGKGDVAFVMQSSPSTRATDLDSPVTKGMNVPIGKVGNMNLYLEETITDLSYATPETRGVPVFTENVGKLYKNDLFVHAIGGGFGDTTFEVMGGAMVDGGWRYSHHYGDVDPWPEDGSAVDFYLRIPSDMKNVTFGENAFTNTKTVFTYTSPATALDQTDIIFAGINLDKATHDKNLPNGTPVTFYHALSGVKFAIANPEDEMENIQVTNISFTGLKNTGTCTVNPKAAGTATDPFVIWTNTDATTTAEEQGDETITKPNVIQQDFVAGDLVEFNKTNNPDFGDSFFNPGTATKPGTDKQNINTQTASKTFWLVPQAFAGSAAVLRISYTINGNKEYIDLKLGEILKTVEWKAGQLRTYTIRLDEVNVKIEDQVTLAGTEANGYAGSTKDNVTITNTGNTKAFIRAAIVGQWLNFEDKPIFGFTDNINGLHPVESWYEDQFVNGKHSHGEFKDLAGYGTTPNPNNGWTLCSDGYYYYTTAVSPITEVEDPADATTAALFSEYLLKKMPVVQNAGEVTDPTTMHFELEIATQAIIAVKLDGTLYNWDEAWERALGSKPVKKTNE
jgi:hypothetical protein